jgi:hypothetical protein
MIQKLEYRGIWFLPENEENELEHITGTLTFDLDKGPDLELLGSLDSNDYSNMNHNPLLILGLTSTGDKITLLRSYEYSRTRSFPGMETCKYQPLYILIGKHFKRVEDLVFFSIKARFKNFELWISKSGFKNVEHNLKDNFELEFELPNAIEFKINDTLNGKIHFSFSAPISKNIQKATIEQKSQLIIESTIGKSFYEIIDDLMYFQNFLTLGTFETAYPFTISIANEGEDIKVFYKPNFTYKETERKSLKEFLFSYQDIENDFQSIISKWYNLKDKIEPIVFLLLDSFYNRGKFTENRFLNIVQGLETFHRRFKKNEIQPKREHEKMIQEILNLVEEPNKSWLKDRLSFSNEPTLHNRLLELIDCLNIETIHKIIKDKDQFIRDTKNSRNYYTHYDEGTKKKALKSTELYTITEKLRVVLIVSVLIETGFSEKEIEKLFKKNEWRFFNHIITN